MLFNYLGELKNRRKNARFRNVRFYFLTIILDYQTKIPIKKEEELF